MMVQAKYLLILVFFLSACATKRREAPAPPVQAADSIPEDIRQKKRVEKEVVSEDTTGAESNIESEGESEELKPRPPVVGVWIDSVALDAFWALGYLQELDKAGVKIRKVMGTGYGCWVALAWAQQGSSNRAQWQAFKWENFQSLGVGEKTFLSRITGDGVSYKNFENDLERWLPEKEFMAMDVDVDCPLVDNRKRARPALLSAKPLGIYRSLWYQLQQPFMGREGESETYLSGWAVSEPDRQEYDSFADLRGDEKVEFWIHLRTAPPELWAYEKPWLYAVAKRNEWPRESWVQSERGRWAFRKTLNEGPVSRERVLDFSERRALLLEGRKMARDWVDSTWFQNNFAESFSEN